MATGTSEYIQQTRPYRFAGSNVFGCCTRAKTLEATLQTYAVFYWVNFMHHSKDVIEINVMDTPRGTVLISMELDNKSFFEIELSPEETSEFISDLKSSLNQLATSILRLAKES